MKNNIISILILLTGLVFSQTAEGPAFGISGNGVMISTSLMKEYISSGVILPKKPRNKFPVDAEKFLDYSTPPTAAEGTNYFEDPAAKAIKDTSFSLLFRDFQGIEQTNSIPPDPYIAVGPNHVIQTVNTSFRISTKEGKTLKTFGAEAWFSNVQPGNGAFDPKVIYDQFSNRWVMVWLEQDDAAKTGHFLVSVSDDADPMGNWFNYSLDATVNGTVENNSWADYQGVGYDEQAIYITGNQFSFTGSFQYTKLRILKKSELYANTGAPLSFTDFWSLKTTSGGSTFNIRPSRVFDAGTDEYYLITRGGNSVILYKLKNSTTNPVLNVVSVPIAAYSNAPTAGQLGGGQYSIETNGSSFTNEPLLMGGQLHITHSIASGSGNRYSAIRYIAVDVAGNYASKDIAMGLEGYWHYYPAVAMDEDGNILVTYSRSGDTSYAGAYYTTLPFGATSFTGSKVLQPGMANYVKDFSSKRNRWGDYLAVWIDPVNAKNLWMISEYCISKDTWATYVGAVRFSKFPGAYISLPDISLTFGNVEIGKSSGEQTIKFKNYGEEPLLIGKIGASERNFEILNNFTFPFSLSSMDSIQIRIRFSPKDTGVIADSLVVYSNAVNRPAINIPVYGKGYTITKTLSGKIYGIARSVNGSAYDLIDINKNTGKGTGIGFLGTSVLQGLCVNPSTKELVGISNGNTLVRVDVMKGEFFNFLTLPIPFKLITFNKTGDLFGITSDDKLYNINLSTGDTTYLTNLKISPGAVVIDYRTNELWAAVSSSSLVRDKLYKLSVITGDTLYIGNTGFNVATNGIAFDNEGNLFGTKGTVLSLGTLFKINTSTGKGTDIGSITLKGIAGIAINPDSSLTGVEDDIELIKGYELKQNYPNPFNQVTTISYSIKELSSVKIKIYSVLGEEVRTLINSYQSVGNYQVQFDGSDLASGMYFYRLEARGDDGSIKFTDIKKMLMVK